MTNYGFTACEGETSEGRPGSLEPHFKCGHRFTYVSVWPRGLNRTCAYGLATITCDTSVHLRWAVWREGAEFSERNLECLLNAAQDSVAIWENPGGGAGWLPSGFLCSSESWQPSVLLEPGIVFFLEWGSNSQGKSQYYYINTFFICVCPRTGSGLLWEIAS